MLKYFFVAYRDSSGPRWGSKFMKAVGTTFLGSPEKKGLGHLRDDIKDTFYYCKEDRILPPTEELEEWRNHAILANEYRQEELPACARAVFRVNVALSILVVCIAGLFAQPAAVGESSNEGQSYIGGLVSKVRGVAAPSSAASDPACQQIEAYRQSFTGQQLEELRRIHPQCF